jgi:phage baseplate assembly protein W
MRQVRYRAWQFVHPDLDEARENFGLQLSSRGSVAMVSEEASVRQAILLLLSTSPGERVMRANYGCDLHRLVFNPNDDTTCGLAIHYVRQALERWERRIRILELDAHPHPENPGALEIFLRYAVISSHQTGELLVPVSLTGA